MSVRKVLKRLMLVALIGCMALPLQPAHAGTSGVLTDNANDVLDFLKHAQNSFRPASNVTNGEVSPYSAYQTACGSNGLHKSDALAQIPDCRPFDITDSSITTAADVTYPGGGYLTLTLHTGGNVVPVGAPVTAIPAPFVSNTYEFAFSTTTQETSQKIGINCSGADTADSPANTDDFTVLNTGVKMVFPSRTATQTCPRTDTLVHEGQGGPVTGNQAVLNKSDVMVPPHPAGDGWLVVVSLETIIVSNGADRQDGTGVISCQGGAATCLDYDLQLGAFEGYSSGQESQDKRDLDPASQAKTTFSVSGNQVQIKLPYAPSIISPDGDLLLDDARVFPWPMHVSASDKVTNFVTEVTGVVEAGANSVDQVRAVCPDDSANIIPESDEPLRTVGKTVGDENKAIEAATRGEDNDDDLTTNPAGGVNHFLWDDPDTPGDQGLWVIGTGSTDPGDCVRGIYGLLTILDWLKDGFQIRLYPRNPAYLPSASSVSCRYPIGQGWVPVSPVWLTALDMGPTSAPSVTFDTSPYDSPWHVDTYVNGDKVPQASNIAGPVAPNVHQEVNPLNGTIGKDQPCRYQLWPYGLHYFDILTDFTM